MGGASLGYLLLSSFFPLPQLYVLFVISFIQAVISRRVWLEFFPVQWSLFLSLFWRSTTVFGRHLETFLMSTDAIKIKLNSTELQLTKFVYGRLRVSCFVDLKPE